MVYAIVKTGGRQEKVSVGSIVVTNRIEGEAGDTVEL
ncbi:bL21 family ribosomal protein, partial [Trueperella sp.]